MTSRQTAKTILSLAVTTGVIAVVAVLDGDPRARAGG